MGYYSVLMKTFLNKRLKHYWAARHNKANESVTKVSYLYDWTSEQVRERQSYLVQVNQLFFK